MHVHEARYEGPPFSIADAEKPLLSQSTCFFASSIKKSPRLPGRGLFLLVGASVQFSLAVCFTDFIRRFLIKGDALLDQ